MRIGVFGGSFNPIHNGHVSLGRELLASTLVDELWYVVSPHNPLKDSAGLMPDALRLEMVTAALACDSHLLPCDMEFHLPRPSYMVDTLAALRSTYPQHEFLLVIGADNLQCFAQWRQPDEILRHHRLLVYRRPGYDMPRLPEGAQVVDTTLYDISSTQIRASLQRPDYNGEGLPPAVWNILRK